MARKLTSWTVSLSAYTAGQIVQDSLRKSLSLTARSYRADQAIAGYLVGRDSLRGSLLASEGLSSNLHAGVPTGSNVTSFRVPAPESPLPGVPAQILRGSPFLGNRQTLIQALSRPGAGFEGDLAQGASWNLTNGDLQIDCNPAVNFNSVRRGGSGGSEGSGDSSEGDSGGNPNLAWVCTPQGCIQVPNGLYSTRAECEAQCNSRYRCDRGNCVADPNGPYSSLSACLSQCSARYSCIQGVCQPVQNGQYSTLAECQANCQPPPPPPPPTRYSCVEGACVATEGGTYESLAECQANCQPPPPPPSRYRCNQGTCVEDPNGPFPDLATCQSNCPGQTTRCGLFGASAGICFPVSSASAPNDFPSEYECLQNCQWYEVRINRTLKRRSDGNIRVQGWQNLTSGRPPFGEVYTEVINGVLYHRMTLRGLYFDTFTVTLWQYTLEDTVFNFNREEMISWELEFNRVY